MSEANRAGDPAGSNGQGPAGDGSPPPPQNAATPPPAAAQPAAQAAPPPADAPAASVADPAAAPTAAAPAGSAANGSAPAGDGAAPAGTAAGDAADTRDRNTLSPILRTLMLASLALLGLLAFVLLLAGIGMVQLPTLGQASVPTRDLLLDEGPGAQVFNVPREGPDPNANIPPLGSPPGPPPPVGGLFESFYFARGGERILGRPISEAMIVNGRQIQWFERARIEHWPEHMGSPYELQLGRLGVEFTSGRSFANQSFFVSTYDLRYFAETGHAVGGVFLRFYDNNGGLASFGLPISEAFDEVLPDGRTYTVQYFERARMEYHPELAGTIHEVQLGLLGTALYHNEARPDTIQPIPTPVP